MRFSSANGAAEGAAEVVVVGAAARKMTLANRMAAIFLVSVSFVNGWFVVMEGTSTQPYTEALANGRPGVGARLSI
jgi:hypothetical protein